MKTSSRPYKIVKSFIGLLFVAMFLSFCVKQDILKNESEILQDQSVSIVFKAYSGDNETKTSIGGDSFKEIFWTLNEEINIFYEGASYKFTSTNNEISSKVDFEGSIEGVSDITQLSQQAIALYPYNSKAVIDDEFIVSTTLPDVQDAVEDNFADKLFISMAKTSQNINELYFYNVCSGLCFTVNHDDIQTVTLRAVNGVDLAGDFKVKFETVDGKELPIVQEIVRGAKVVTVKAPNGGNFVPGKRYYIATLPVVTNGIVIEGFRSDGTVYQNTISKSVTFKRKVFARKLNFDEGLSNQSLYDYVLNVTSPEDFYYKGEVREEAFVVESYRFLQSDPSVISPVSWKAQAYNSASSAWQDIPEGEESTFGLDWLTMHTYTDTPGAEGNKIYGLTVAAAAGSNISDAVAYHKDILQNNTHPSGINNSNKSNAIDLSNYDLEGNAIAQTTANSYVVQSPGWYKFPIVYGNAIKNGATNEVSYKPSITASYSLTNFIDHLGNNITQPWVTSAHSGGAYDVMDAKLLWQDEKNLVTDVTLGNGEIERDYIYFYVDRDKITQGNAVIAAYANGKAKLNPEVDSTYTVWSWHIWVTDVDFSNLDIVTNYEGVKYEFFPCHLGWTTLSEQRKYDPRETTLQIIQSQSNKTAPLKINQRAYETRTKGNQPYYQWGRKDPFVPNKSNYDGNVDKTWYDANGTARTAIKWTRFPLGLPCIISSIQKPDVFNNVDNMDQTYINLWSAHQLNTTLNNNIVVKTVYDPSPIGFTIPAPLAWTGFTTDGKDAQNAPERYSVDGSWTQGYYFWTDSKKRFSTFYPTSGMRYCGNPGTVTEGGKLIQVASNGGARSTTCRNSYQNVYQFFFFENMVMVRSYSARGIGDTVRPVKEK